MSQIGTLIQTQETPPAVINNFNTANAFMVGLSDWGPVGASGVNTPYTSLGQVANALFAPNGGLTSNARNSNNATLYDSADAFFREGGANLYVSRVLGPNPTFGNLVLQDSTGGTAATLTAAYLGQASTAVNVVVVNNVTTYVVTLQDTAGNVLAISPSLSNTSPKTDLINWAATTGLITAVSGASNKLPASVGTVGASATNPLSAGNDNRASATITNWTNALNSGFPATLGPGQVMAPNQNNTSLAGIWSALGTHALNNNRMALLDGTDGNSATQAISEITTAAIPSTLQSYCGLWVGNLQIPGVSSGTTRVIPPSPVVAALCARADNLGNPNLAAAGTSFPLQYVSGVNTVYNNPLTGDIATLNSNGANVFSTQFNILQNYGFVSLVAVPTNDAIYWQFNHGRLRMALSNSALITAQPFLFGQLDGAGQTISAFSGALSGMLGGYYAAGALFGASSTDAFSVNATSSVNTPASLAAGNLIALLAVRMSPFAQLVTITINAVPITQSLIQTSGTNSTS